MLGAFERSHNKWMDKSLRAALGTADSKRPTVSAAERGENLLVRDWLSLSLCSWTLRPLVSNKELVICLLFHSLPFGFKKSSKTTHILKDYQAHFHQTLKTLTIQVEIHIRGLIRPFGRPCLSLIIAHLVGTPMPCEIKSLNVSGITICVVFMTGNSFILFSMIPRLMKCISLFIS